MYKRSTKRHPAPTHLGRWKLSRQICDTLADTFAGCCPVSSSFSISILYCGDRMRRRRGRMRMNTRRTHGDILWVDGERKCTLSTAIATSTLTVTSIIVNTWATERERETGRIRKA